MLEVQRVDGTHSLSHLLSSNLFF